MEMGPIKIQAAGELLLPSADFHRGIRLPAQQRFSATLMSVAPTRFATVAAYLADAPGANLLPSGPLLPLSPPSETASTSYHARHGFTLESFVRWWRLRSDLHRSSPCHTPLPKDTSCHLVPHYTMPRLRFNSCPNVLVKTTTSPLPTSDFLTDRCGHPYSTTVVYP